MGAINGNGMGAINGNGMGRIPPLTTKNRHKTSVYRQ
jgi:hypothetical protein